MARDEEFERKKTAALAVLMKEGVFKKARWPWQLNFLWALGFKIKPPLFGSFIPNAISLGLQWGLMFGVLSWIFLFNPNNTSLEMFVGLTALGALFFGLAMAGVFYLQARIQQLPSWESL
ncbi:DUF6404 family protein [Chitinibacter sp. FCG-7]|uniref:DUF6404 family protein n=1 Tax=Chitinibacter mangrovi TaxID=3153927 RepID=A0AAU7FBD8_9NEIS